MSDYKDTDIKLARYSKALAHPARIAILSHLNRVGNCMCKDLVELLPVSQATVSQHLKELIDSGLVKTSRKPPASLFTINSKEWNEAREMITGLLNSVVQSGKS